jgi:hypothetical protein
VAQFDAVVGIETRWPQRHPIFGRITGETVLLQIGSVGGRRVVVAQHDDASLIVLAPQFLGRGKARSSAADDDNFLQHSGRAMAGAPRMPEQLL